MSDNTLARMQNQRSLNKDIGLAELDGFQLPRDVTVEFLNRMQKNVDLLDMVDVIPLARLEQDVPKLGVPRLSGGVRGEEESRTEGSDVESGEVSFNATDRSYYILFEPKRDAIKNTHYGDDEWGNLIIDEFSQRFGNDIAIIGMRAGSAEAPVEDITGTPTIDDRWDGWIARAEGDADSDRIGLEDTDAADTDSMPEYDNTDGAGEPQPVDTETFHGTIQTLDSRYRNPDNVAFLINPDHVQQYEFDLTTREDGLGVAVLQGDTDVTPFDYDIVAISEWPVEYGMFTDPDNLAFGPYEEMELDQTTDTDKVHEEKLHSRNWLEAQFDFQIKELQAGVLMTGLADPNA